MRKSGFTMIELLVVIALIALIAAMLVPSLLAAKNQAREVLCCSNLRQLSMVFSVYQQELGVFPYGFSDDGWGTTMPEPPGGWISNGSDKQGWWWFHFLHQAVEMDFKQGSILWCPSRQKGKTALKQNILIGNYGVNRSVCKDAWGVTSSLFSDFPLRPEQVRTPSATMLIGDSGYALVSWMAAADTGTDPYENPLRVASFYIPGFALNQGRDELLNNPDAIRGRHSPQMLNIYFADGHSESRLANTLAVPSSVLGGGKLPAFWQP